MNYSIPTLPTSGKLPIYDREDRLTAELEVPAGGNLGEWLVGYLHPEGSTEGAVACMTVSADEGSVTAMKIIVTGADRMDFGGDDVHPFVASHGQAPNYRFLIVGSQIPDEEVTEHHHMLGAKIAERGNRQSPSQYLQDVLVIGPTAYGSLRKVVESEPDHSHTEEAEQAMEEIRVNMVRNLGGTAEDIALVRSKDPHDITGIMDIVDRLLKTATPAQRAIAITDLVGAGEGIMNDIRGIASRAGMAGANLIQLPGRGQPPRRQLSLEDLMLEPPINDEPA